MEKLIKNTPPLFHTRTQLLRLTRGALVNMKRHDYLPFGEELFVPTGGRTAAQGYAPGDGIRQQFTQKERDVETGLDFFGERYYANALGRFTSVDPLGSSAETSDPQTMNRYTYVLNNPLRYIDPDGLDTADAWSQLTEEEQTAIQSKLKITKKNETAQAAFNALVTAGTKTSQDVAKNVATIKNFISAIGGTKNSAVWQQIGTINSVDLRGGDQSSVLTLSVRSEKGFTDALNAEGYSHNDPTDVWANQDKGRLDSLREKTPNSTDPELHLERTSRNPSEFNAHWDPTSVNFKYVRGRFEASAQTARAACYASGSPGCVAITGYQLERGWAASQHGTHPSPAVVREYQKRVGLAPK